MLKLKGIKYDILFIKFNDTGIIVILFASNL